MKKIIFFGDSITDMGRLKLAEVKDFEPFNLGIGYPQFVNAELSYHYPLEYKVINKGISGNRTVDLYSRIKKDVWNEEPDYLSILIGANDIWHFILTNNGIKVKRFEKLYRMIIEDTMEELPHTQIILCEPFLLRSPKLEENYDILGQIVEYAAVVKKLAEEYHLPFVPLTEKIESLCNQYGFENYLYDGVHPNSAGSKVIAEEWLKCFLALEKKEN